MLGPPKARALERPVLTSLEALVPPGDFYRHLEAKLDLSFVREWVADRYAERGRPSIDPVVFFKLQLVMFFEGLRSERKLIETASLHLAHRWYLRYALDEPLPDHSSLRRIRTRLGLPLFRRFFEHVVQLCLAAGLVWGKDLFFDATKVRADAATASVVPRLAEAVDGHLVELFGLPPTEAAAPNGPDAAGREPTTPAPPENVIPLPHPAAGAVLTPLEPAPGRWDLLEECRLDSARPLAWLYQRLSDERVSRPDPDAALLRSAGQRAGSIS